MKNKFSVVTLISLLVTSLGVIIPISWDYFSGQKGLAVTLISHSHVISPTTNVEGLEISYKGTKLSTLSRATFLVENTGNRPIHKSDIVTPIKIRIPEEINILDAMVESKNPSNLDFRVTRDKQLTTINFSLLNPGDKASVSLLTNSSDIEFSASARITGVKKLDVNREPPKTLTIWALIWIPVGILSLLLIVASLVGFIQYPKEVRIKNSIKNGDFFVPEFGSYEEAHEWVGRTFDFTTSKERAPVFNCLKELEEGDSDFNKDEILNVIHESIPDSANNLVMALIVFSVGLFGLYYSLHSMGYM